MLLLDLTVTTIIAEHRDRFARFVAEYVATVADDAGTTTQAPNPGPLRASLQECRRMGRQCFLRIPGSEDDRAIRERAPRRSAAA